MQAGIMKKLPKIINVFLYSLLFVAVLSLMSYVQNLLDSDAQINLTEIVTQNKDVITSKLNLEVNNLDSVAKQIVDRLKNDDIITDEQLQGVFVNYMQDDEGVNLFLADREGIAIFPNGDSLDISGRRYFRLAKQGIRNISDRIVSRKDGEDIFVISVPLKYEGEIIGTVQKSFTPEEMYSLCSISLFSSQGYMYIINKDGYILLSSEHDEYIKETDNYFRMMYAQGNEDAVKELQSNIQNMRSGFFETLTDGKKTFSAYTPIEEIHDWYLISSVETDAVSPNANIVIKMFYIILLLVVLIFGISLLCFLYYKNKQQTNLEQIAFVDSVTKGDTYNKFVVKLQHVLQEHKNKQYHLLRFDIDNFKYINNFYGFDFGDRILWQINHNVSRKLLQHESIARISSDHFIVLLEDTGEERLNDLLDSIQNEEDIMIYFSAGLYTVSDRTESINLMVDKAGIAARTIKGSLHKRLVIYSETFDQLMIKNEQLKRAVRQALIDNEIIPYYQPKIDVNTGEMVGAEALARWMNKDGELIPPFQFIPMCEKTGMVTELDLVIFEKVLQFLKCSIEGGIKCVPISVNFSRLHLLNKDFITSIMSKIEQYGVPTRLVEIELTESAIFENYEVISEFIAKLHENGFSVSMDDFGSGYSSLNMLKDIPIDVLKIDKGFIDKTTNSNRQRIIFTAIAQMAKQLEIKVVVEGVEFIENVELMKEVGCFVAQGYYFAKPMEEAKFEKIYREGKV